MLEGFTRVCLETLCTLITEDSNVATYIARQPAVDYKTRRYTDWIKPWLEGRLAENQKLITAPGADKKAEELLKVVDLIDKYEESLIGTELPVSLGYVIVEAVSQKEVKKEIMCDGKLTVEVYQTACEWVESTPAGTPAIDAERLAALKAARFQPKPVEEVKAPEPQEGEAADQPIKVEDVKMEAKKDDEEKTEYEPFAVCEDALFRFVVTNVLTDNV